MLFLFLCFYSDYEASEPSSQHTYLVVSVKLGRKTSLLYKELVFQSISTVLFVLFELFLLSEDCSSSQETKLLRNL